MYGCTFLYFLVKKYCAPIFTFKSTSLVSTMDSNSGIEEALLPVDTPGIFVIPGVFLIIAPPLVSKEILSVRKYRNSAPIILVSSLEFPLTEFIYGASPETFWGTGDGTVKPDCKNFPLPNNKEPVKSPFEGSVTASK